MTETFKVGDRVTHDAFGPGEITYGPLAGAFASTHYAVKFERCEEERQVRNTYLTALPAFAVGDTVAYEYGSGGKLVAGPFKSGYHDEPIWVVEKANGTHIVPTQNSLTKVVDGDTAIKVGDRVRIIRATYASTTHGKAGVVTSTSEDWDPAHDGSDVHRFEVETDDDSVYAAEVEKIDSASEANTFTHDGVTYDLSAQYRDSSGYVWSFTGRRNPVGVPRITMFDDIENTDTVMDIEASFGPLTRV